MAEEDLVTSAPGSPTVAAETHKRKLDDLELSNAAPEPVTESEPVSDPDSAADDAADGEDNGGGSYFQPLSWSLRMKIALGAAKGLAFLHNAETKVIYRDFKTSNILSNTLLDSNYNAKLSDFGFARDGPTGDKSHVSTRVMGTYGYAAPEYLSTGWCLL